MRPLRNVPTASNVTSISHVTRRGHVIGERYRLEKPLERGAMGTVWRAEHVRLKAPVAVKFLDPSLIGDTEMHDRFMQEARSAAAVRSAHVVQVFDYGSEGGVPYIVMELLDGENLDARLGQRGALSPAELNKIFSEVARGISKAHAMGVVHRDLKPGNIFITREGDHEVTKLVDFGIAKVKSDALKFTQNVGTQLGTLLGTPQYMSPEQVRGATSVDHRTDLWALGILACECLTGQYPFSGRSIGDLTVQICTEKPIAPSLLGPVPAGFDQWFFKATSKKRSKRFSSADEMAEALSAILTAPAATSPATGWNGWALPLPSRSDVRSAYTAIVAQLDRRASWLMASARRAFELLSLNTARALNFAHGLPTPAKAMASGGLAVLCSLALLVEWRADPSPLPPQSIAALTPRLEAPAQAAAAEPQHQPAPAAPRQLEPAPAVAAEAPKPELAAAHLGTETGAAAPPVTRAEAPPARVEPQRAPVRNNASQPNPKPAAKAQIDRDTAAIVQRQAALIAERDARLEAARAALATAKPAPAAKEAPARTEPRRKTAPRATAKTPPPSNNKVNPFAERL